MCAVMLAAPNGEPAAATLTLKSGKVKYEVEIKTLGMGGSTIVGTNSQVIGQVNVGDGNKIEGGLIVPVVNFESNNSRRDKDIAKILKYKEHPAITIEIVEMQEDHINAVLNDKRGSVPMKAKLTVAGGSKVYDMILNFERTGEQEITCATETPAKFTDFGLKPPSFGLILKTAPDAIKLSGDMVFTVLKD
jgi:polyisoprenoid-binding protein YceI